MKAVSFSELVKPFGEEAFAEHFSDKKVVHIEQNCRSRFEYLFPWTTINGLLAQNLLDQKRLRIARDGRDVPPVLYRRDNERNSVNAEKLAGLLKQQASVVINKVQDLSPPVRRMARQMEALLKHQVNVNGYITFGTGGAFAMHYDPHDVLVLQVYGNKRWFLYDQEEPSPLPEQKTKAGKPFERNLVSEFILEAGDVLYVPRGVYHRAAVTDTASVHLTFGIHTAKGFDFVDSIRDKIMDDVLFRQDIGVLRGAQGLAQQESALKDRLCEIIRSASLTDFIDKAARAWTPVDRLQIGPDPEINDETVLGPLVRYGGSRALRTSPAKDDAQTVAAAERVLGMLMDRDALSFAELRSDLDKEFDVSIVRSAVAALIDDFLIEVIE